jgi:tetratricopeptide (TPR) repeat protein
VSPEVKKLRDKGFALLKSKKYKDLEKQAAGWVKANPDDPMLRYIYGRALFYQKKTRDAVAQLEKSVSLDGTLAEAYYELGGMYLALKQKPEGVEALEAFVRLKPKDKRVPLVMGVIKKMK